jgi:RpiR family transcriptional regulator, carbohydrate utilization regulator
VIMTTQAIKPNKRRGAEAVIDTADGTAHFDDLLPRLAHLRSQLRPAERRVADVVLRDVEGAVRASNTQLAQAAGVSEPTVTRFSRALGCEGVRDFKIRLAQSFVAQSTNSAMAATPDREDDTADLPFWNAVFGQAAQAINLAERQLDPAAALEAIRIVAQAKRVFCFGVGGGSTTLAQDMQYRLFRHGIAVTAYTDTYLMRMAAASMKAGDAAVAISATGRTRELLEAVKIAQGSGGQVVAVTVPDSELAAAADISLTVAVPEIFNLAKPTASRFAYLAILDLVATGVAYRLGPEGQETWRRVKLSLMRMREGEVLEPLGD